MVAWTVDILGGTEKASGVSRVCQTLDLHCLICPPRVLKFPHPALDSCLCSGVSHSFGLARDVILPCVKGFPFFGDQLLYLCSVLIKPVLVFSGLIPKGVFTGIKDGGFKKAPVVIRIVLLEAFLKRSLKSTLGGRLIQALPDLYLMNPPFPLQFDGHCGAYEAVVCHGPRNVHILPVPGSYNDIINEMPMFRAGVSPGCLKFVSLVEKTVSDGEVILSTFAEKQSFVGVNFPSALFSYGAPPDVLVPTNPGIEVSQENDLVFLGNFGQCLI